MRCYRRVFLLKSNSFFFCTKSSRLVFQGRFKSGVYNEQTPSCRYLPSLSSSLTHTFCGDILQLATTELSQDSHYLVCLTNLTIYTHSPRQLELGRGRDNYWRRRSQVSDSVPHLPPHSLTCSFPSTPFLCSWNWNWLALVKDDAFSKICIYIFSVTLSIYALLVCLVHKCLGIRFFQRNRFCRMF